MIRLIGYLKQEQQTGRYLFYGTIAGVLLLSLLVDTSHAHTWMEKYIPGFWSIFAIVSCIVLIFFARWLASAGIEREEGYYDD
jgi:hypothetical protein